MTVTIIEQPETSLTSFDDASPEHKKQKVTVHEEYTKTEIVEEVDEIEEVEDEEHASLHSVQIEVTRVVLEQRIESIVLIDEPPEETIESPVSDQPDQAQTMMCEAKEEEHSIDIDSHTEEAASIQGAGQEVTATFAQESESADSHQTAEPENVCGESKTSDYDHVELVE